MNSLQHSRRHFLAGSSMGIGATALAWMLQRDGLAAPAKPEVRSFDTVPRAPTKPARAKAMISLWMQGGPSHIDLFDPKPDMAKWDGKLYEGGDFKFDDVAKASTRVLHSPWKFTKHGQSGMDFSELVPHMAQVADDLCMIRSMHSGVNNHVQGAQALQMGRVGEGLPSLGAWLTYGLGCEADNLPSFVALTDPGQLPVMGVENWQNGYLPSLYQGTVVRPTEPRILDLTPPARLAGAAQDRSLELLNALNRRHLEKHPGQTDLEARIASYALAAKMQTAATEALDLSRESKATQEMYGMHDSNKTTAEYGARCLIARRLVERGVRFVQIYTQNQLWDHHGSIIKLLPQACLQVDKGSGALVTDLKQRGLLDETVVHWGGEMGRLPVIEHDEGLAKAGRDHNTYGFSQWMAGGGFKGGHIHGATDELGHKAVENIVNHYDYHATLLHLFGIDHTQLTFERNAQKRSLTDGQPGKVVQELLA